MFTRSSCKKEFYFFLGPVGPVGPVVAGLVGFLGPEGPVEGPLTAVETYFIILKLFYTVLY